MTADWILGALLVVILLSVVLLAYDALRGRWALVRIDDEERAGQRRDGNRVLWYRVTGTEYLFRTEGDAYRFVVRDLDRKLREQPDRVHIPQIVMPWWVWDGKDPLHPFGREDRA